MSRAQLIFRRRAGFTLVEVLISIAIALVLILGISRIFSLAQQTTGAGNAVIGAVDRVRGVQGTLAQDFRNMTNVVGDSPGIVIVSYAVPAFRSAADRAADRDGNSYTINDPAGPNSINLNYTQVNDRIHRIDKLIFFARDRYPRMTGEGDNLTSAMTSDEAMIVISHAAQPNNAALIKQANTGSGGVPPFGAQYYNNPGDLSVAGNSDDHNLFASNWILAREVMLLTPVPPALNYYVPSASGGDPLASWSQSPAVSNGNPVYPIYSSRYDVVATSISTYRQLLGSAYQQYSLGKAPLYKWWEAVSGISTTYTAKPGTNPAVPNKLGGGGGFPDQRYQVNPFLIKPTGNAANNVTQAGQWLSTAAAQSAPAFVRGCSQFIVEFAGDFVTQDATGKVGTVDANGNTTNGGPDGQIDYVVDPVTHVRQIRWYGFPRQSTDEGKCGVTSTGTFQYGAAPLRDTVSLINGGNPSLVERCVPLPPNTPANLLPDTANNGYASSPSMGVVAGNSSNSTCPAYVCAWGPDTDAAQIPRPKMIRIIMAVDDPGGHLNTQQVYEYVYNLP